MSLRIIWVILFRRRLTSIQDSIILSAFINKSAISNNWRLVVEVRMLVKGLFVEWFRSSFFTLHRFNELTKISCFPFKGLINECWVIIKRFYFLEVCRKSIELWVTPFAYFFDEISLNDPITSQSHFFQQTI